MEHTIHIGDLVRVESLDPNQYEFGVVQKIKGETLTLAMPLNVVHEGNMSITYYNRDIRNALVEPLTNTMITNGVITQRQYNEAIQFKNIMENKKDSSGKSVLSRAKGRRKKTNKKRKSKSSRSKKRRHRK